MIGNIAGSKPSERGKSETAIFFLSFCAAPQKDVLHLQHHLGDDAALDFVAAAINHCSELRAEAAGQGSKFHEERQHMASLRTCR